MPRVTHAEQSKRMGARPKRREGGRFSHRFCSTQRWPACDHALDADTRRVTASGRRSPSTMPRPTRTTRCAIAAAVTAAAGVTATSPPPSSTRASPAGSTSSSTQTAGCTSASRVRCCGGCGFQHNPSPRRPASRGATVCGCDADVPAPLGRRAAPAAAAAERGPAGRPGPLGAQRDAGADGVLWDQQRPRLALHQPRAAVDGGRGRRHARVTTRRSRGPIDQRGRLLPRGVWVGSSGVPPVCEALEVTAALLADDAPVVVVSVGSFSFLMGILPL